MNKRIEKMVERIQEGKTKGIFRRDQIKKALEENGFDYIIYQGYDEIYDVKPVKKEANLENVPKYWWSGANIWGSTKAIDNKKFLVINMTYGYSYIELYVEIKDNNKNDIEINLNDNNTEITYNEEKNGIEVSFANKPAQEVLKQLKESGFRWHRIKKVWYAKDTEERRGFINSLVPEDKEELLTENKIKPFSDEEMEQTNKIIDMIIEMNWKLLNAEINKEDNCIYGNVKKSNGSIEKEGLYAPSDDLHELDGVYRCLKGKIINNVSLDNMEEIEGISTLHEEKDNVINLEDHREKNIEETEEDNSMEMNFDDILESFDNMEIKNKNRLCDEDLNFLEDLQEKFNNMREKFNLYIDFYRENKLYDLDKEEIKISCDSLEEHFVEKVVFYECSRFIGRIYGYFNNKYDLQLKIMDFDKDYSLKFREEKAKQNLKWFMETLDYNLILDDIFNQLEGVSFKEKGIQEIKKNVIERTRSWKESRISIKGKNLSLKDYICYGWESDYGRYEIKYSNRVYIENLLKLISLFETGDIQNNIIQDKLDNISVYGDVTGRIFQLSYKKIKGIKFFKNGKVQLIFDTGVSALEFAQEYLNYKEVA